jgi:hypothetical protein
VRGRPGEVAQHIGEHLALALVVKRIAMAGRVVLDGFLSSPQTLACVGNRVVLSEPLPGSVEQVHAPCVSVAMPFGREQPRTAVHLASTNGSYRFDSGQP